MEQLSNALAMERLGYGQTMRQLSGAVVENWLAHGRSVQISFPNVAKAIVEWLQKGVWRVDREWVEALWRQAEPVEDP